MTTQLEGTRSGGGGTELVEGVVEMDVEGAGVEEVELVLEAVEGRSEEASERDWACADLGCIIARCRLDNCWRTECGRV